MNDILHFFINSYQGKPTYIIFLEAIVLVFGILSVWYAKKENILVYPTGLIATVITVYLFFKDGLLGDMMMNFYWSAMSIFGWWNWARSNGGQKSVKITRTTTKEKYIGVGLFLGTMIINYSVYRLFGNKIEPANYIDIFTSGLFFTAMWYMALKKLENWTLWIIANIITIPLYAFRGWGMLSLQYIIFTVLAIQAYNLWKKNLNKNPQAL